MHSFYTKGVKVGASGLYKSRTMYVNVPTKKITCKDNTSNMSPHEVNSELTVLTEKHHSSIYPICPDPRSQWPQSELQLN